MSLFLLTQRKCISEADISAKLSKNLVKKSNKGTEEYLPIA
jgi:hypothetical protein